MERIVEHEWLDELPADDPQARQSRHDIHRINLLSGHPKIIARSLLHAFNHQPPQNIADIGAGNGQLLLSVARQLNHRWRNVNVTLVDRVNGFDSDLQKQFAELGWHAKIEIADALEWSRTVREKKCDAVIANHFLHQIHDAQLREMFSLLGKNVDAVVAAEPRRGLWPLFCSRLVWLVGSAAVTRYDAPVSVRAGFRGHELSALWPDKKNWEFHERAAGWFSHLFVARRKNL